MDVRIVNVTPGLAVLWTHKTTPMRNPYPKLVTTFANEMRAGNWEYLKGIGGSLKFDRAGLLVDGLHRLLAVIEADITVKMLCVFGIRLEQHVE